MSWIETAIEMTIDETIQKMKEGEEYIRLASVLKRMYTLQKICKMSK